MTMQNPVFLKQCDLTVAQEFHHLVESRIIPATSLSSGSFWQALASLLNNTRVSNTSVKLHSEQENDVSACTANIDATETVALRTCSQRVNPAWGSLYDALYNDNVIPHTTGLKPGNRINAARHGRVVRCAKDFLDKTFPLSEGSHKDAVSYMPYFQNLLVILADGSTTGLAEPKQYVGKNGPADSPDSIMLIHNGTHTEVVFDQNSHFGSKDLASIDDILLETSSQTVFDFAANGVDEKCSVYENWLATVCAQKGKAYSNRDGDTDIISNENSAIVLASCDEKSPLVNSAQGSAIPDAVVDTTVAALVEHIHDNSMQLYFSQHETLNDTFIAELQQFLQTVNPARATDKWYPIVKVNSESADTRATMTTPSIGTTSHSGLVTRPQAAIATMKKMAMTQRRR